MTSLLKIFLVLISLTAPAAYAAPVAYRLDADKSQVGFGFSMQGSKVNGTMPISDADIVLDLDNIPASQVKVTLSAKNARAGMIFVTQTMKGPNVLDTARHPAIQFTSTRIVGDLSGAQVHGNLTIRGTTRPATLQASLFRARGTSENSRDQLVILLTGTISRAAFKADGFPGFVGDEISLRIVAHIKK